LNVKQSAMRGGRSMSEMRFILPPLSIIWHWLAYFWTKQRYILKNIEGVVS
jgi:hypothetical protein